MKNPIIAMIGVTFLCGIMAVLIIFAIKNIQYPSFKNGACVWVEHKFDSKDEIKEYEFIKKSNKNYWLKSDNKTTSISIYSVSITECE